MNDIPLQQVEGRDMVVMGASAGGVEALARLLAQIPAGLPAAICIVQHISPTSPGLLPAVIGRDSALPVSAAQDREAIRHGRVYVAPPDHHLLVKPGFLQLTRGPRENRARPAIDPLFRSAAVAYGPRVIGVLLTGMLDDGSAGLAAIRRCGGQAIIQDPADARYPDMPSSALDCVTDPHCLPLAKIGDRLVELVRQPPDEAPPVPPALALELNAAEGTSGEQSNRQLGDLVAISCPECGGPLRKLGDEAIDRYRCRVGHSFSAKSLLADQDQAIEQALWAAVRAMEERAAVYASLAARCRQHRHEQAAGKYDQDEAQSLAHAKQIRQLLTGVPTGLKRA